MKLVIQLAVLAAIVLLCIGAIDASPMKKLRGAVDSSSNVKLYKPVILMETGAEAEVEAEAEEEVAAPVTAEELAEAEDHSTPFALLETSEAQTPAASTDSNPTYVLPYPPLMPHFFTPFLNPYSNVNPLSFPYNYYYGQGARGPAPGGMPPAGGFGGPGMMQPGMGGQPGFGGGHPYYPYYSFMERRTHLPWQLRTVGVGANNAPTFPQFLETETEVSSTSCKNCNYN